MSAPHVFLFRLRYRVAGGHTHIRVFAGRGDTSLGNAGEFVLRNEEFEFLRAGIERSIGTDNGIGHDIEFVEDRS